MNGKTAKKLLMRGRTKSFWGRRAYLTVRLPLSLVPTPCPEPVTFAGLSAEGDGTWMNEDTTEIVHAYKASIGTDPRKLARMAHEPVYFATKEYDGDDGYEHWTFWTGTHYRTIGTLADGRGIHEKTPIDEATVARHKAYVEWHDRLHHTGLNPVLDAFVEAGDSAKATYFEVEGDNLLVTYGVKYFYPNRKRRFAAKLARAFRTAKALGIQVRALRA